MSFKTVKQHRLTSIDALRGLAALMVVVCHARAEVWVGASYFWRNPALRFSPAALLAYLSTPLGYGVLGVQLLFVVSGYCIHRDNARKLVAGSESTFSVRSYLFRRFVRIYPTFIAALVLTWGVDALAAAMSRPPEPAQSDSLWTAIANASALQGLIAPPFGSNVVLWTLAIEIHFYLAYPILLAIRRRLGPLRTLALVLAISLVSSLVILAFNFRAALPFWIGGCPIFLVYWFTWTCGFFIAEAEVNSMKPPAYLTQAGCACLVLGIIIRKLNFVPLDELFFAVAAGSLVAAAVFSSRTAHGRLVKVLGFIGIFSYSLYLTHRPFVKLLKTLSPLVAQQHLFLLMVCLVTAACVVFGWLFYQLIECWSLRAKPFETLIFSAQHATARPSAARLLTKA